MNTGHITFDILSIHLCLTNKHKLFFLLVRNISLFDNINAWSQLMCMKKVKISNNFNED